MVLFTGAALLVGVLIVGFMFFNRPGPPSIANLTPPASDIPAGVILDGRTMGSPDAKVTIEIWADFQCPGCMQLANLIEPPLIAQYVAPGTARIVFHDAAFQGRGNYDESVEAAAAARCAADQGLFWQMHDWLFANSGERVGAFLPANLRAMSVAAGLDLATYDTCMAAGDKQDAVRSETQQALTSGVQSTPTILLNGNLYMGHVTVSALGEAISAAAQ